MRYFTVYVLNTVIMFNVFVTLSGVYRHFSISYHIV